MCDAKVTYIEYHLESTYLESMVLPPLDGGTQQPTESRPKRWDSWGRRRGAIMMGEDAVTSFRPSS
jgi:hypothetical protein